MLAETKRLHPYELPALLVLPTEGGSAEYCSWIVSETGGGGRAMSERYVLAIDQGTTSTRAILFDEMARPCATAQAAAHADLPGAGLGRARPRGDLALRDRNRPRGPRRGQRRAPSSAIGITNQRETTVVWERATGRPLANAIVWQDRRTADLCAELREEGWGAHVTETTGLIIDPYFSATKLAFLLRHVPGLEARARAGEVCFGTVDSFLAVQADRRQAACDRRH